MIGGQVVDLLNENNPHADFEVLQLMDSLKTGALIEAACVLGCIAAGADEAEINAARTFAQNIGLAFQIKDDILDVTSDTETLGKPVGSDEKNEKATYVSLLGIDKSKQTVEQLTNEALAALDVFDNGKSEFLRNFAISLADRKK